MSTHAAITVLRPREEAERLWTDPRYIVDLGATVRFADAPGGRGTEIHIELQPAGPLQKLVGRVKLAKAKDELRRFKRHVEAAS